jgi:AcrR family transcriptional regulator
MTDIEVSRRERKKEETKERILDASFGLFRKQGFEATTVEEICERADVAKGTFFNYFPHKEAVFSYLSESWVADAEEQVGEMLAHGTPTWERVCDAFIAFAGFYEQDRALAKHMAHEWTRCIHVVRALQSCGQLRRDVDPIRAHRVLSDIYHDTIMMWLASPEPPFGLREEIRQRLTLVVEGLGLRSEEVQ